MSVNRETKPTTQRKKWAENVNNKFKGKKKKKNVFTIQQNAQPYSQLKKQKFSKMKFHFT